MNVIEHVEVSSYDGGDDKIVKRSPFVKKSVKNITRAIDYLSFNAKIVFNHLKQAFTKALIFQYFDLKLHIQIKTNALGYVINKVLS